MRAICMGWYIFSILIGLVMFTSCQSNWKMATYEKNIPIPNHNWYYAYPCQFEINLQPADTAYSYNLYVTVRHREPYAYSNLWILFSVQYPDTDSVITHRIELPLADVSGKWMASGISDIYEHRIPIKQGAWLNKVGRYQFSIEQIMRENPLPYIMNIGLRIEKDKLK